jgi:hypothetical protein
MKAIVTIKRVDCDGKQGQGISRKSSVSGPERRGEVDA